MKNTIKLVAFLAVVFVIGTGCKSQGETPVEEVKEVSLGNIRDIFAGVGDVYILREDSTLWGIGYNNNAGQFGLGDVPASLQIASITDAQGVPFSGVKAVTAGENHTVILKEDGTLWGTGDSSNGELGMGTERLAVFTQLQAEGSPVSGVKAVTAGNNATLFAGNDGGLWVSGYNYYGELGTGSRNAQTSFAKVESAGQGIKSLAAGMRHTVLLKEDGTVWTAGYNYNGQLGLGDADDRYSFTEVTGAGSGNTAVAAGNYHTVILKSDGSVWAAGSNYWGQLGLTAPGDCMVFTRLNDENGVPLTGVKEIAARGDITVITKADGSLLLAGNYTDTEGRNEPDYGAGEAPPETKPGLLPLVPEEGAVMAAVKKTVLGNNSVYVIDVENHLWAAGSNHYGQLNLGLETEVLSVLKLVE